MLSPGFLYMILSVVLFTVAVVVRFHSSALSLPISPLVSILTIILPIASFLNAYIHPSVLHGSYAPSSGRLRQLSPIILQTSQALLTTVLATLLFQGVVASPALSCDLENEWMRLFRAHDGATIRRIQDTLDCCGYNSVRDRAFPFTTTAPSTCAETYGRAVACVKPWRGAMQVNSGLEFGIVMAVGLMQIIGLLAMREGTNWWTAWRTRVWAPDMVQPESRRPLLGRVTAENDIEEVEDGRDGSRTYGGMGGDENSPRVEPSLIRTPERNAWSEA